MPIEKIPTTKAPWPPTADEKGRTPAPYPLTGNARESFYTIADDLKKKGVQVEPIELVKLNFRTTDPAEVNWYLKTYVGCTQTTVDGKNYSFAGLVYNDRLKDRALIYVPRKVIEIDEPMIITPGKPGETTPLAPGESDDVGSFGKEFEVTLFKREFSTTAVRGEVSVTLKGKFQILNSDAELAVGSSGKEVGFAIAKKITDDISIQAGGKVKIDDFKKPGKDFFKTLRESLQATVSKGFQIKSVTLTPEVGVKASDKPFLVAITGAIDEKSDIGKYLPSALGMRSVPVAYSASIGVGFELGPSPALLRILGPAFFIAAAFIGFIGFGAWYAGRAARRGDTRGLVSYYTGSYLLNCGFRATQVFPGDDAIEALRLIDAGAEDARRDIEKTFPGRSFKDALFLWQTMWIMAAGARPGEKGSFEAGAKALEDFLLRRLSEKFDF